MRPLDRVTSIKLKLGLVILAAIAVSALVSTIGARAGLPVLVAPAVAAGVALALVQVLARGMTSPLREMAAATRAMAGGDYARRVRPSSRDEVGELARAFNAMAADLAEVDRMRRDLVANVSHELRTPISALQANLENLADGVTVPDERTIRTMLAQVQRLGRLVSQLLDLSQLESGAAPMRRQTFDLEPVLRQAAAESRLQGDDVAIELFVDPQLPKAHGDPERIHQVVANLLENARRFSPLGGRVDIRARRDHDALLVEVEDQGPGIAPADRERVFERFYRSDTARSRAAGGAGLGLAIARWIVDGHGGDIRIDGHAPGCRMTVRLPAA